mmetsp:Transcript_34633/g.111738  ORF Transcript_34633/g.111738 Transcript_34633/m.111738 type:complete len:210 (+) Transcript_34633:1044-1673(+)
MYRSRLHACAGGAGAHADRRVPCRRGVAAGVRALAPLPLPRRWHVWEDGEGQGEGGTDAAVRTGQWHPSPRPSPPRCSPQPHQRERNGVRCCRRPARAEPERSLAAALVGRHHDLVLRGGTAGRLLGLWRIPALDRAAAGGLCPRGPRRASTAAARGDARRRGMAEDGAAEVAAERCKRRAQHEPPARGGAGGLQLFAPLPGAAPRLLS